jgi:hypothetical protein
MDYSSYRETPEGVLWDFRQFYVEWVKEYMTNFSIAQFSDNYPAMLDALEKWHGVIWGRSIKEFKVGNIEDKTFSELMENITKLANNQKFKRTYFKKERNPEAIHKLNESFKSVLVYLVWLMKKNKLFGSDVINRGLT